MKKHNRTLKDVKASYEHWQNDYKLLVLFGGQHDFVNVFDGRYCAICGDDCYTCPLPTLSELNDVTECGLPYCACAAKHSPYECAFYAHDHGDKQGFMKARNRILKRLKRAINNMEKEGGE